MSDTQLALNETQVEPSQRQPLADLRAHALSVPVDVMQTALQDYAERRGAFREWLLTQLVEGLHYGYVPGTEPKFDERGNMISKRWDNKTKEYKETRVAPKSWQAKRCLYKAGAEFIIDLMGVRAKYAADVGAWQQLGGQPGNFVIKCELVSRATGEPVGEGIGARKVGTKGGDENNAVKMAQKAAMVAAVLNSYGLSDLFTQDMDEKPLHENPEQKPGAPAAKTRSQQAKPVTVDEVTAALDGWKQMQSSLGQPTDPDDWRLFVNESTGRDFNLRSAKEWTQDDLRRVQQAIDTATGVPF